MLAYIPHTSQPSRVWRDSPAFDHSVPLSHFIALLSRFPYLLSFTHVTPTFECAVIGMATQMMQRKLLFQGS